MESGSFLGHSEALADAKAGDALARAWFTKYLLGDRPVSLLDLAAAEAYGSTADDQIRAMLVRQQEVAEERAELKAMMAKLSSTQGSPPRSRGTSTAPRPSSDGHDP